MQKTASETMKPPGNQPAGLSPRKRAKLLPAVPERTEKCWRSAAHMGGPDST